MPTKLTQARLVQIIKEELTRAVEMNEMPEAEGAAPSKQVTPREIYEPAVKRGRQDMPLVVRMNKKYYKIVARSPRLVPLLSGTGSGSMESYLVLDVVPMDQPEEEPEADAPEAPAQKQKPPRAGKK